MRGRGPRSLRARVAIAAAVAIGIAILVLGGGVLAVVGNSLRQSLDDGLRARSTEIVALQATTPALLDAPGALDSAVAGRALLVEVVDGQGRLLHRSLALGGRVRVFALAEYYLLITLATVLALGDVVRGVPAVWERAEGTR